MNYVHTILPAMTEVLGPADTRSVATVVGHQIGMQYHQAVMGVLGDDTPFVVRLARLLGGHGPRSEVDEAGPYPRVRLTDWRLFDPSSVHPVVFDSWNSLWEGLATMDDRRLVVHRRLDLGDPVFEWEVRGGSELG